MDGHKPQKCTILPIKRSLAGKVDYGDQEYLNLYPPTYEEGIIPELYVHEDTGKLKFKYWLSRKHNRTLLS